MFTYHPDVPLGPDSLPRNSIYALLTEWQIVHTAGLKNIRRRLAGLILSPGVHPDTWVRTGVWKLRLNIYNVKVTSENMEVGMKRWREYKVISSKWEMVFITLE